MLRTLRNKQGQSTAEYAILIGLIIAVAVGMQTYVKRGLQGKTKDAADDFALGVESGYTAINDTDVSNNLGAATLTTQYEPTELSSQSTQKVSADTETSDMTKEGAITRTSTRTTEQKKGDYQKYGY